MQIIWHGQSCFQITTQKGKNNLVSVVIDPFDETIGLRTPKMVADVLLITHSHHGHDNRKAVLGLPSQISEKPGRASPFVIDSPGEYEIKEVFVQGISSFHDNSQEKERGETIIYIIEAEGIRLCHLGDLDQKELTIEQVEKIGDIDILMLPIGGIHTISAEEAVKIMSQIEPKIIIPMYYQIPNLKVKLEDLTKFLKIIGMKTIEPQSKLSIKKKDISGEEAKVIILKP